MGTTSPPNHLAEWYRSTLTDAWVAEMVATLQGATAVADADDPVRLILSMAVPSDEVLYVVFEAASSAAVVRLCERAGLPPQRVTADVDARIHVVGVS
ncbi:MAG: hypothetical protein ABW001_16155 [Mycobacterium sp.]